MSETNGNRSHASVGVIEDTLEDESSSFPIGGATNQAYLATAEGVYDPANPVFAPPKSAETRRQKTWKRKLISWCLILFLIGGGALALYLLLRVNQVNVKVQADPRREAASTKTDASQSKSENGLSAEAINIARQAIGTDTPTNTTSPSPSVAASPSPSADISRVLSFTETSPAYSRAIDGTLPTITTPSNGSEPQQQAHQTSVPAEQPRANPTQTLFVEDLLTKPLAAPQFGTSRQSSPDKKVISNDHSKSSPLAVTPQFGTMLPVRTQGVIFSLRNNAFARLELTRDCQGEGWSLPKGTLLIGRVSGSDYDRAYISVQGYIDPRTNRFVKMAGEVLGSDGGSGVQGKRTVVDRNRLKQTLGKVASGGLQVAGMMAGALTGRGTVVLNGAGYRVLNPVTDQAGQILNGGDAKRSFVKLEAGQPAYVMVSDLPKEVHPVDAPGEDALSQPATSLTDREVMELILFGTPDEIRTALSLMNEEQKRFVVKSSDPEK
jgi:hypothetical protein